VTFEGSGTTLTAGESAALARLAKATPETETTSFEVAAYAAGAGNDPSTARRLSLSRALAVRDALVAAGVPAAQVYVRALGATARAGPPNRAEITVMGANGPAAAPEQGKQP
jgi:outer membrane protein OmpA-like peptidoglycan-associated protein